MGLRATLWIIVAIVLGVMVYVRLAPTDPARWHQPIGSATDMDMQNGAVRIVSASDGALTRLNEIALATPRTRILAGSVEEGRITYETRSKIMGFPDYTTADVVDGRLRVFARSRFGRSDFGVNRARIETWLAQL